MTERCGCTACFSYLHASDCAVHNAPALPGGPCDCKTWLLPPDWAYCVLAACLAIWIAVVAGVFVASMLRHSHVATSTAVERYGYTFNRQAPPYCPPNPSECG